MAAVGYRVIPAANPSRYGLTLTTDVAYRSTDRRAHRLDVYQPHGDGRSLRPAVLYVHGGAFSMLSKDTHRVMALQLAARGFVVFNINYRLGPRHRYPAPLEDVAAALGWVCDHAEEWGADPTRLAVAGESAGANLVTALTYIATHPRPEPFARALFERQAGLRATLAVYGMHDMHDVARLWRDPRKDQRMPGWVKREILSTTTAYLGDATDASAAAAPLASPLRLIAGPVPEGARPLPPFLLTAGTADPLLDDSRRLARVLEARGVEHELHVYPGEIHGFDAMLWRPAAQAKWRAVARFLRRHLEDGVEDASAAA